jgi:uncharacterized membrane protein YbhN (UPF0104 family)
VFLVQLDRLPARLDRFRVVQGLRAVSADTRRVFLAPAPLARLLAWGMLTHLNITFAVYVLGRALDLDIGWLDCLALVPPVLLASTLPISIGGWGVREGAMIAAFALIGVPSDGALVLSVLTGLAGMAAALPGGALWLLGRDHRIVLAPNEGQHP